MGSSRPGSFIILAVGLAEKVRRAAQVLREAYASRDVGSPYIYLTQSQPLSPIEITNCADLRVARKGISSVHAVHCCSTAGDPHRRLQVTDRSVKITLLLGSVTSDQTGYVCQGSSSWGSLGRSDLSHAGKPGVGAKQVQVRRRRDKLCAALLLQSLQAKDQTASGV